MGQGNVNAYEDLSNAIILQAVKDYRRTYKKVINGRSDEKIMKLLTELEEFFQGGWFEMLTAIDGKTILKIIQRMEEKEHENRNR